MDGVEAVQWVRQGVRLVELERVARLGPDVHAHHLEACAGVAHGRAACPTEEVEEPHSQRTATWAAM
jgi:hypothetical protein